MYILINDKLIKKKEARLTPLSKGFMYGYGAFETLKVIKGRICFLKDHIKRLKDACNKLNIAFEYDLKTLKKKCYRLLKANNKDYCGIKIVVTKNDTDSDLIITTRDINYKSIDYKKGFKICFSKHKRNPESRLVYLKCNNYLENILERQAALNKGYNEVIFMNVYDKICEGAISNIFFIKDKTIYTPSIDCGILPGITRKYIIDIIKKLNFNIKIGKFKKKDLLNAEEIFISNSLMDIMPISKLEDKNFKINKRNITYTFLKEYKKMLGELNENTTDI
ncbi:MAG: 4-amino-4-deoxychorismate lyase [Firmicutes bacterium]|nr:4-amino-4-deoxychorismate lyase [Bacillota bacterium]